MRLHLFIAAGLVCVGCTNTSTPSTSTASTTVSSCDRLEEGTACETAIQQLEQRLASLEAVVAALPATDSFASLSCTTNQIPKFDGSTWICSTDENTDTTLDEAAVDGFAANNGYLTSETDPSVNALGKASLACSDGEIARWNTANSTWLCTADVGAFADQGTVAEYTGGIRFGNFSANCDSASAGTVRWNGLVFEGCDGFLWEAFGSSRVSVAVSTLNCASLGYTVGAGGTAECGGSPISCDDTPTWYSARDLCESEGARLCTQDDIKNGAALNSGCGFNFNMIWTSTRCGTNGNMMVLGDWATTPEEYCEEDLYATGAPGSTSLAGVRCCGDN